MHILVLSLFLLQVCCNISDRAEAGARHLWRCQAMSGGVRRCHQNFGHRWGSDVRRCQTMSGDVRQCHQIFFLTFHFITITGQGRNRYPQRKALWEAMKLGGTATSSRPSITLRYKSESIQLSSLSAQSFSNKNKVFTPAKWVETLLTLSKVTHYFKHWDWSFRRMTVWTWLTKRWLPCCSCMLTAGCTPSQPKQEVLSAGS